MTGEARAAIEQATMARPADSTLPDARFALDVPYGRALSELVAAIAAGLAPLAVRVEPFSATRDDIAMLVLPGRVLRRVPDLAFGAAYALVREFGLELAEPDLPVDAVPVPDERREDGTTESIDDFPPGCWAPKATLADDWAVTMITAPAAWRASAAAGRPQAGEGIVVAQPDTGVARHREVDGVRRFKGFNLVETDRPDDPTDPMDYVGNPGHGTGTASALASPADDPVKGHVVGAAPRIGHMPIRCIESVVRLSQVRVAQAIDLAVDEGAHVITMSLGGLPSFSLHRALRRAVERNVIVLAAAGNCVREVVFPARYSDCIAVAGVDSERAMWRGSCRGPEVDISAPAENVFVAKFDRSAGRAPIVDQGQGTSFAVALTAGVAALWLAHHGRTALIAQARARRETLQVMFRRLVRASAQRPAGWDDGNLGAGIVDAALLLATDLDAGLGRETVESLPAADDAAGHIRRFVAARAGDAAAAEAELPWELYGPELVLALLDKHKGRPPEQRSEAPEAVPAPPLSAELAAAARRTPALATALGAHEPR